MPIIATIVWKEWRQQAAIVLAIVALGGVLFASVAAAMPDAWAARSTNRGLCESLLVVAVGLVVVQGIVTGAMLFAGESEERTQEFLDQHSGLRGPVWLTKMLTGLSIVLAPALALGGFLVGAVVITAGWMGLLCVIAAWTFAWSAYGSASRRTTFGAVGWSLFVLAVATSLQLNLVGFGATPFLFVENIVVILAAMGLSWRAYCASDGRRRQWPRWWFVGLTDPPGWMDVAIHGFLTRQRWTLLILGGMVAGCVVDPRWAPAFVWPIGTFLIGCVAGWAVFRDETGGGERFLGDQRLPPTQVWLGKVVPLFAAALAACAVLLMIVTVRDLQFRPNEVAFSRSDGVFLHTGWADCYAFVVYGFATAVFVAQQTRKLPVAVFLTLTLGGGTAALWYPSLFHTMPPWRMWVVPVVLLAASWLCMRRWMSGRMRDRSGDAWLSATALALSLWIAANLWWRVHQFPDPGEPFDRAAAKAWLAAPSPRGDALREARAAARSRVDAVTRARLVKRNGQLVAPDTDEGDFWGFRDNVVRQGYPDKPGVFGEIIDDIFAGDWVDPFAKAALAEPDRSMTVGELGAWESDTRRLEAEELFLVRAMARVQRGDVDGAVADFDVALAGIRHDLHRTNGWTAMTAIGTNTLALQAIESTFTRPIFQKAGYRTKVAALLAQHDEKLPGFAGIVESMERLADTPISKVFRDNPEAIIDAPWEQVRRDRFRRRAIAMMLEQARADRYSRYGGLSGANAEFARFFDLDPQRTIFQDVNLSGHIMAQSMVWFLATERDQYAWGLEYLHGLRLALAASEFAAAHGRPAKTLDELSPEFLRTLPQSAYIGGQFRFATADSTELKRLIVNHEETLDVVVGQQFITDDAAWRFFVPVPR